MGLRKCRDCGGRVSKRAKTCPHCGAPIKKQTGPIAGLLSFVLAIAICAGCFSSILKSMDSIDLSGAADTKAEHKPPTRKERIEAQFSPWDGSHLGLTKVIKKLMNDPDSYKHVETVYWDMGDHLVVRTTFRGKNAFGGVVTNWIKAKVDLDGKVLEILDQGP